MVTAALAAEQPGGPVAECGLPAAATCPHNPTHLFGGGPADGKTQDGLEDGGASLFQQGLPIGPQLRSYVAPGTF